VKIRPKSLKILILMLLVNSERGSIFARNNSKKEAFPSFKGVVKFALNHIHM
jgi:hypothetical protein